jgi:hypothetical protein
MADARSTGGLDAATSSCSIFSAALAISLGPQSINFAHATIPSMASLRDVLSMNILNTSFIDLLDNGAARQAQGVRTPRFRAHMNTGGFTLTHDIAY